MARENGRNAETGSVAAAGRGLYIPSLPASSQTTYSSLRRRRQSSSFLLLLLSPQNLRFCGRPLQPVGFCFSKILHLCHLGVTKSACPTDAEKCLPTTICPHSRWRSHPLFRVSRKQRYNTLDFAKQNRVPTGMLRAPIGNPVQKGIFPLQSLIFLAGAYTNCQNAACNVCSENTKPL